VSREVGKDGGVGGEEQIEEEAEIEIYEKMQEF
jgi:hypothetical protein